MTPTEFTAILSTATAVQVEALESAHWRYMNLVGIIDGGVSAEVVAADREGYPQFIQKGNTGLPIFNDADCVAFMVVITGLSAEFCAAWRDKDFYELHGESGQEMAVRQNATV